MCIWLRNLRLFAEDQSGLSKEDVWQFTGIGWFKIKIFLTLLTGEFVNATALKFK